MATQSTIATGGSYSIALTGSSTISFNKFTYNILGEDVETDSTYGDPTTGICIALINTIGIQYYNELKKQNIQFSGKIGYFLEEKLKSYHRDQKIEQVIK